MAVLELDSRTSDGITVDLLWDDSDGQVRIRVTDHESRWNDCDFPVAGEFASRAFQHPFAYAQRGAKR